jgi:UDP-N-acetylmuramate--alanine ligase
MVINGGVINRFGSNAKFGDGEFLVAESDESDASFVDLPSFIGVVNNIEPEHMDFYKGDFELVKNYYKRYVRQIPTNGLVAMCIDDIEVSKIYEELSKTQNNVVSMSVQNNEADYFAFNISGDVRGLKFDVKIKKTGQIISDIKMPTYGVYNIKNALGAVAIADFLGLDFATIKQGLANFSGVKRRFTKTGEVEGVTIIDDYGHHPTEIKALFKAAKEILPNHKLIAVFQPHKYSRTQDLFSEFCNSFKNVDTVIVADVYGAGQEPIEGISQDSLIDGIRNSGHKNVLKLDNKNDLPRLIKNSSKSGDMVICAGAGSISNWANELPSKLQAIAQDDR